MSSNNQELCSIYHKTLCEFLHSSYEKQQLCDVTLIAALNQQKISAHRVVLGAMSPYFAAMFTGDMVEKDEKEIVLKEIDGESLKILIDYCYMGYIPINEANVYGILETASRLEFPLIESKCFTFLMENVNSSNCLTVFTMVEQYLNFEKFVEKSLDCAAIHFGEIAAQHEFLLLNNYHLNCLLRKNELNVWSEEEIFNALVKWVEYSEEERKHDVTELLHLVRFNQLRLEFLQEVVDPFLQKHNVNKNAFTLKFLPDSKQTTEPRTATITPKIIAFNCAPGDNKSEIYCPQLKKWKDYPSLTFENEFCCSVVHNNVLYIIGSLSAGLQGTVHTFDFTTEKIRRIEPINTGRYDFAATVMHDSIYIAGGERLTSVERYDLSTGKWTDDIPLMLQQRTKFALVALKCRLIAIGGWNLSGTLRSVEAYDEFANKWYPLASMNLERNSHSGTVYKNKIYVVGGNRDGSLEYYDPNIDKWTLVDTIKIPRYSFGMAVSGCFAVVTGGRINTFGPSERSVIEIDLKTLACKNMEPMKYAKGTCSAFYMPTYNPN